MKTYLNTTHQKIVFIIVMFSLVFSIFSIPKKANAQVDVVTDPGNTIQSTITAANTTASAFSAYSIQFKEYVLDGLGLLITKQIIRQITASVVTWINSGFQGSPSFLQNPGSFFLDVADQLTGDFLAKVGGPLVDLCSPFSIDIRIALAFKYHPNIPKRYACTIGAIIKNSKNAVENASINGFTAGDFKQGGWPAFVSLTTEPQNNAYGAYITADSELSWRVANAQSSQKDEISAGKGFLSWRDPKCAKDVKETNAKITSASEDAYFETVTEGGVGQAQLKSKQDCPIQTPGSVINESLQNNLNGPLRELELADEINEVVNALFAQLVTVVLQQGLGAVTSKGTSGSSYLQQTVVDLNNESNPQFQSIKTEILKNITVYKPNTLAYKKNRDDALNAMIGVKTQYDAVKACYSSKTTLSNSQASIAQTRIAEIDSIISTRIAGKTLNLLTLSQQADLRVRALQDIENLVNVAKTVNDLRVPSEKYAKLLQDKDLVDPITLLKSSTDLQETQAESADLQQDALRKMQMCQIF